VCCPGGWAEDLVVLEVVHVYWDTEHGGEGEEVCTDVAVAHDTVVGAPVVHDGVGVAEDAFAGDAWAEPGGRPGWVGALVEGVVDVVWKLDGDPFSDLKGWAEAFDEVQTKDGGWHAALGLITRAHSAAREVFGDGWVPGGFAEAAFDFLVGDFPVWLHHRVPVGIAHLAGAIEGRWAGVDEVEESTRGVAAELVTGDTLDGFW